MRAATFAYGAFILLALAVPVLGIYPVLAMQLLCFAMFACAFNLLLGYSGMLSFGHAAFFGFSSYVTSWLIVAQQWNTVESIVAGVVVGSQPDLGEPHRQEALAGPQSNPDAVFLFGPNNPPDSRIWLYVILPSDFFFQGFTALNNSREPSERQKAKTAMPNRRMKLASPDGAYQAFQSAPREIRLKLSMKKTAAMVATRPSRSKTKTSTE